MKCYLGVPIHVPVQFLKELPRFWAVIACRVETHRRFTGHFVFPTQSLWESCSVYTAVLDVCNLFGFCSYAYLSLWSLWGDVSLADPLMFSCRFAFVSRRCSEVGGIAFFSQIDAVSIAVFFDGDSEYFTRCDWYVRSHPSARKYFGYCGPSSVVMFGAHQTYQLPCDVPYPSSLVPLHVISLRFISLIDLVYSNPLKILRRRSTFGDGVFEFLMRMGELGHVVTIFTPCGISQILENACFLLTRKGFWFSDPQRYFVYS